MGLNTIEIAVVALGVLFVLVAAGGISFFCCRGRLARGKKYKKIGTKVPSEANGIQDNAPTLYYAPTISLPSSNTGPSQSTMALPSSSQNALKTDNNNTDDQEKERRRLDKLMRDQLLTTKEDDSLSETILIMPNKTDDSSTQIQKQQKGVTDATLLINT